MCIGNFLAFFSKGGPDQERDAYIEEKAKLVWELVGEATVPPARSGDA